jgi:small subunit ribosomal protein S17
MAEAQGVEAPATSEVHKPRTQKIGRVVSNKMEKTVIITVDYVRRHPIYNKRITRTSRFVAHDAENQCKEGDLVRIEETRPLSKTKRWVVREVLEKGIEI